MLCEPRIALAGNSQLQAAVPPNTALSLIKHDMSDSYIFIDPAPPGLHPRGQTHASEVTFKKRKYRYISFFRYLLPRV